MAIGEKDIALIERYLTNDLTEEELSLFEAKKTDTPGFSEEIDFQKKVLAHIQAEEKAKLKSEMLKDFRSLNITEDNRPGVLRRIIPWAAAAVLLLISTFYFVSYQKESSQDVFEAYFQAYDGVTVVRGDEQSMSDAMQYYNAEEFSKALDIFLKIEDSKLPEGQLNLLISSCYLKAGQPEKALEELNKIEGSENASIRFNKVWYLALTALAMDKTDDAKEQLQQIAASSSMYASEAANLLEEAIFR